MVLLEVALHGHGLAVLAHQVVPQEVVLEGDHLAAERAGAQREVLSHGLEEGVVPVCIGGGRDDAVLTNLLFSAKVKREGTKLSSCTLQAEGGKGHHSLFTTSAVLLFSMVLDIPDAVPGNGAPGALDRQASGLAQELLSLVDAAAACACMLGLKEDLPQLWVIFV